MDLSWLLGGLVIGTLLALVAVGLALTFSLLRFVNFAHGDLVAVGAYLTYVFLHYLKWHVILASVASVIITSALGALVERIAFRPLANSRLSMFVSSFGVSLVINAVLAVLFGSTTRSLISDIPAVRLWSWNILVPELAAIFIAPTAIIVVAILSRRTNIGLAARAIAENRALVDIAGISSGRVITVTFAVSAGMAAVAGSAFGALYGVSPQMGSRYGLWSFLVIILAGFGEIGGIALAALCTGVGIAGTMYYTGSYTAVHAVVFALMALALLVRPAGLFGRTLRKV
jgi:branched-chain amino acid transport system permease protein